jgi:glycosyltransferase involved in cell wall biosynthesis
LIDVAFCIPGDLTLRTGGYRYDRELLKRLPSHGVLPRHVPLPGAYPHPSEADLAATVAALGAVAEQTILMIDGLALGAMPAAIVAALPHRLVALVHHPLGLEAGLAPKRAEALLAGEKAALAHADRVIVTSRLTQRVLAEDFAVPLDRIAVAEPGTDPAPRAAGAGPPLHLLAVGAVSERKAYPLLVDALAALPEFDWRLTIAGSLTLSPAAAERLRDAIARSGVAERIALIGAPDDDGLASLYGRSDIFVAASLYEGYGMALAEALARGLPIVASTGGAAAETLPEGAALKVPPGDAGALAAALRRLFAEAGLRRVLGDAAWEAARRLPTWDDTARVAAAVIKAAASHPRRRAS